MPYRCLNAFLEIPLTQTIAFPVFCGMMIAAGVVGLFRIRARRPDTRKETGSEENVKQHKAEFLAMISKDILPPIDGILRTTSLLQESGLDRRQMELAVTVKEDAERVLGIISEILDFSKLEDGTMSIDACAFDLLPWVESAASLMAQKARSAGIELSSLIDNETPRLLIGDGARLRQICVNFLGQALQFTSQGNVLLELHSKPLNDLSVEVTITVQNTGKCLTAAKLSGLSEPSERGLASASEGFRGSGLGLRVSARIAELMGGKVGMDRIDGGGTMMWASIPFKTQSSKPEPSPPQGLPSQGPLQPGIVLDETGVISKALQHYVLPLGIDLQVVRTKTELNDFVTEMEQNGRGSWIFINDPSGEKAGMICSRDLISKGSKVWTRVVLLADIHYRVDGIEFKRAGISGVLRKPLRRDAVKELIHNLNKTSGKVFLSEDSSRTGQPDLQDKPVFFENSAQLKILAMDDNELNVTALVRMLNKLGFGVEIARAQRQALDLIEDVSFDILFMDDRIVEGDGREVIRRVRDLEEHPKNLADIREKCHVIAITADTSQEGKEKCLKAGVDECLRKPIQFLTLQSTLGRHLQSVTTLRSRHRPVEAVQPSTTGQSDTAILMRTPSAETSLLNRETLTQIRSFGEAGGADPLKEFLELFSMHGRREFERLQQALQQRDLSRILESVQSIKGNSANIGATSLHLRLVAIEESAHLQNWEDIKTRIAAAEQDFSRSICALEREMADHAPS